MNQATLHQLRVFEAAARHRSFTRAAEELFLTQPSVSMQVKQLAKVVGMPLFEQVGKRLYLTEAGEQLLLTCRDIFERLAQFEMTVANLQGLKEGKLRLTVVTTAQYIIPRLLGVFCHRYPGIDVSLQVTNHEELEERLSQNLDDLYILSKLPENFEVTAYKFLDNPLVVLASSQHPLANEKNIPIERLKNEPFIMREPGSGTRKAVKKVFEEHGVSVKVRMELGSNEAIKQAIAGGLGISVVSRHVLALEGFTRKLKVLDVQGFPLERFWYVIYPKNKQISVVAEEFLKYLINEGKKVVEETADYNFQN